MIFNLRKNVLAGVLAVVMTVGILPTTVFATENDPVSKDKLETIVYEEVDKLDFSDLGIDKIIDGINSTVTTTVQSGVNAAVDTILTADGIKAMVRPIIIGLVENAVSQANIPDSINIAGVVEKILDGVLDSGIVEKVLTSDLVNDIIDRTVEYAVDDIMNMVKIPTAGDILQSSKEEVSKNTINYIYNASQLEKITTYCEYDKTGPWYNPTYTFTAWKRSGVKIRLNIELLALVGKGYETPDLSSINYEEIVANAAKRAVRDVINERIESIRAEINYAIQNKIEELKLEAQKAMEQAVKDAINSIKNKFPWKK